VKRNCLLFVLLLLMPALAQAMPRVIGNAKDPQCREAFALALASYRSDNFLFSDVEPPKGWPAHLLLGWDGQNNADIWYDKAAFVERSDAPILYWQLHPSGNKRFVGIDIWPNWKGDYFNILLIDAALSEAQVRAAQEAGTLQSPLNEKDQIRQGVRCKDCLTTKLMPATKDLEPDSLIAVWDIVLRRG